MEEILVILLLVALCFGVFFGGTALLSSAVKSDCLSSIVLYQKLGLPNKIIWVEGKGVFSDFGCYIEVQSGDKNLFIPLKYYEEGLRNPVQ